MAVAASGVVSVPGASCASPTGSRYRRASGAAGQNTRHGRHVEHAEEHRHAFHDARPDLVVEGVPIVDVPAIHGFDAEPDLLRAGTLNPLTRVRDLVFV